MKKFKAYCSHEQLSQDSTRRLISDTQEMIGWEGNFGKKPGDEN